MQGVSLSKSLYSSRLPRSNHNFIAFYIFVFTAPAIDYIALCSRDKDGEDRLDRHVRNEVLKRVEEERNILHTVKRRKDSKIDNFLRRNCLLKHVIEEKI